MVNAPLSPDLPPMKPLLQLWEEPIQQWEGISEGAQRAWLSKSTHSVGGIDIRRQESWLLNLYSASHSPCLLPPCFSSLSPRPTPHVKLCVCHCCSHAGRRARDPGDQLSWLLVPRPVSLGCGFLFA